MTTARTLIRGALTDLGVAAAEEPISASQADDGLMLLNQLLGSFSVEKLWIYTTPATPIVWPAGHVSLTWGPGGNIPSPRPIKLSSTATYTLDAYDYPLEVLERQEQYAQIQWKGMQSTLPIAVYYEPQVPLGVVYIWPVAQGVDYTVTLYPWQPLGAWASLDEDLKFPYGYERTIRTNLALECAPSYGVQPSPVLVRIAEIAKQAIQVPNAEIGRLRLNPGSGVPSSGLADFYSGRY